MKALKIKVIKEKVKKVNFGLYPTSLKKANELASRLGRSISNLLRWLIDERYKKEFGDEESRNA